MENYIVINGKKVELTEEQLKKLGIEVKEIEAKYTPFEKEIGCDYYYIDSTGTLSASVDCNDKFDYDYYNVANYCKDSKIMEQRRLHETLNRLLWRFSMQNGGDEIDWENHTQRKYYIFYDSKYHGFHIGYMCVLNYFVSYFISEEIAERAINEIIKPFIKEHPDFVW